VVRAGAFSQGRKKKTAQELAFAAAVRMRTAFHGFVR
jgi:hypothetical protein